MHSRGQQTTGHRPNPNALVFENEALLEHDHALSSACRPRLLLLHGTELSRPYDPENKKYLQKKFADLKPVGLKPVY